MTHLISVLCFGMCLLDWGLTPNPVAQQVLWRLGGLSSARGFANEFGVGGDYLYPAFFGISLPRSTHFIPQLLDVDVEL